MKGAVSYSLFGYGKDKVKDSFDFPSYMRGFAVNLRMCKLLYPDWAVVLNIDQSTYDGFKDYFDLLKDKNVCTIEVNPSAPLCLAMLWRLKPIFTRNWDETYQGFTEWTYTHVICRDLDSLPTYKEAQAVKVWIDNDTSVHAITDSDSHSIPMMGGMVGFRPHYITERIGCQTFKDMMNKYPMELSAKGSDQTWMNTYIYPTIAQHGKDSITQHYFEGMPKTFLGNYYTCRCPRGTGHADNCPNNVKLDLPDEMKESNYCTGHCGCAGYYPTACGRFFRDYEDRFKDMAECEKLYPDTFYWINSGSM